MNAYTDTDQLMAVDGEEVTLAPAADAASDPLDAFASATALDQAEVLFTQEGIEDDVELIETAPF